MSYLEVNDSSVNISDLTRASDLFDQTAPVQINQIEKEDDVDRERSKAHFAGCKLNLNFMLKCFLGDKNE